MFFKVYAYRLCCFGCDLIWRLVKYEQFPARCQVQPYDVQLLPTLLEKIDIKRNYFIILLNW